ncbi:MAG: hypothetical protein NTW86_07450 [Candidatus Sumerlaeota bacterium]|nr:hypothetical protein [Candidatus Sumerlaeota bacterium]
MRTPLNISEAMMRAVKREAALRGQTLSEPVEGALRAFLQPPRSAVPLPPLPAFRGGSLRVDVANRDALYEVFH